MKKYILVFVLILSFVSFARVSQAVTFDELVAQVTNLKKEILSLKQSMGASTITAASKITNPVAISKILYKKGSTGKGVLALQKALQELGYFPAGTKATEYFGLVTASAVAKFQAENGLPVTGVIDTLTKSSIEGGSGSVSSSKEGTGNKITALCLNRVSASINYNTKYLGFVLGLNDTDQFLYVMPGEKPSLFPYNISEDDLGDPTLYPHAPYVSGSATSRLHFNDIFEYYSDNYPTGAFDLVANPDTGVDTSLGKIYMISADGTKYNNLGASSLSGLPLCTGSVRTFPGTVNFGTCTDGIQNGDETGIDMGGRCGTSIVTQNTSFAHWARETNPVTLGIVNSASAPYAIPFNKSKISWDQSPVINFTDGNQIRVVNGTYNEPWVTATIVQLQNVLHSDGVVRSHIIDAEVRLNDTYLAGGGQYDSDAWRLFAVCHGMGHALGLSDRDVNKTNPNLGTCMDYTVDPVGNNPQYGPLNNMYPSATIDFPALQAAHHVNPGDGANKPAEGVQTITTTYTVPIN